jgi:protocatechuate 3,4-dioxygenase beta subunit
MKYFCLIPVCCLLAIAACTQSTPNNVNQPAKGDKNVGSSCEGCEAIYETPTPFELLKASDTLADFNSAGPKLVVSGTIYQRDGKTPAPGVVMYFYHTDQAGIYPTKGNEQGWEKRHGYLRGWIKTDKNGHYEFYTLIPASYPNSTNPKHIHAIIKENGKTAYWIDDFLFANDPLLPKEERNRRKPIGGNGVLVTNQKDGTWYAERNIILGLNVDNYQ